MYTGQLSVLHVTSYRCMQSISLIFAYPDDNSITFEQLQQREVGNKSSKIDTKSNLSNCQIKSPKTVPKIDTKSNLSNCLIKSPKTVQDNLSCGSKSEGEIESEDDELDNTINDDGLVLKPPTPPDSSSQSTEATTVSSLPGMREDVHLIV